MERAFEAVHLMDVIDAAERYNRHILEQAIAHAGSARSVLDFGAGRGRLATGLVAHGFDVHCVEPDAGLRQRLAAEGLPSVGSIAELGDRRFDYVVSVNVLEHCPDDAEVVRALHGRLSGGGRCFIYVPAFQMLWSANDALVGHHRRYSKLGLSRLFTEAGFTVEDVRYVDSLGFVAALAFRYLGRRDGEITARSVRAYDRLVFPASRILDRALQGVVGKNLLLRAVRS